MLGANDEDVEMFHYFDMRDMVPDSHILKLIDKHIDLSFIRDKVRHLYSEKGRPSVDPEVMLRMLLVGYLFGITSERRLCEEVAMHIGYRWFAGLSMSAKVPDHSTFSKNRHGRFKDSGIWEEVFDEVVLRCVEAGLVRGKHLSADGTLVEADASLDSMEPVVVSATAGEYLRTLEKKNPGAAREEMKDKDAKKKLSNGTHRSTTDPDARLAKKPGLPLSLYHQVDYVMDNQSRVILDARVGFPGPGSEMEHALTGLDAARWRHGCPVSTLGMDGNYRDADFLAAVLDRGVTPYAPLSDMKNINPVSRGVWPIDRFEYDPFQDCFTCPQGKKLKYRGMSGRQQGYRASAKDCSLCPDKALCTKDTSRVVSFHANSGALRFVKQQMDTKEHRIAQKFRKRIESLFGEAKEQMGLRRMKFRGHQAAAEQVLLTAAAQNIKRLVQFLRRRVPKPPAAARQTLINCKTRFFGLFFALFSPVPAKMSCL